MPNPTSVVLPKPASDPKLDPLTTGDDEFTAVGEWLRKLALGLTAALLTARAYFPGEPDLRMEAGTGLTWALAILVTAGIALASFLVGGSLRLRCSWIDAAVIALMMLVGVSTSVAADHRTAINLAWQWGAVGVVYLLLRNLPRTRGETIALAGALLATAVAVAVYGMYQVGVELEEIRALYRANPQRALRMLGITPGSSAQIAFENRVLGSTEPWSTFALTNSLAGFVVGPLVVLLAVAWENLRTREGRGARIPALILAAFPGLALLVCLLLTKSRSAWVGLAVSLAVLAWRERRMVRTRTLVMTALVGLAILASLVGAGLATGKLDRLVLTQSTKSLGYRWQYWVGTWRVITQQPGAFWRGVGPGNFGWSYVRYKLPEASEEIVDPHNMVLEAWETAGVWAAVALVGGLVLALWNLLGRGSRTDRLASDESGTLLPSSKPATNGAIPIWLVLSGGAGLLAVVVLGELNPFAEDLFTRWLVLGAAWLWAVMFGYVLWRRLPLAGSALGLGALAVMVNLLAAGGIGIPSVAVALWALIALGLNLRDDRACSRLRALGGRGPAFLIASVWAALMGLFVGAITPYWRSERAIAEAETALEAQPPNYKRARAAYLAAADRVHGDQLSARPYLGMAYLEMRAWRESNSLPENKLWQRVPISLLKAVSPPRNPNAWTIHRDRALQTRAILTEIGARMSPIELTRYRGDVVNAARNATLLYPTNAALHALLAEASADIGMMPDAVTEGEEALRLDQLMRPHPDKRLPESVRKHLENQIPLWRASVNGKKPPKA